MTQEYNETVHKPKHWFTTYYVKGEKRQLDNNDTMAIAVAKTAHVMAKKMEQDLGFIIDKDLPDWHRFIDQAVCYFSSYCYKQRAGDKDDPDVEIGKAKNYDYRFLNGDWENELEEAIRESE